MSALDEALASIRRVHAKLKTPAFSELAGVPYSTAAECVRRNFEGRSVQTLLKFAEAAESFERQHGRADNDDHGDEVAA